MNREHGDGLNIEVTLHDQHDHAEGPSFLAPL